MPGFGNASPSVKAVPEATPRQDLAGLVPAGTGMTLGRRFRWPGSDRWARRLLSPAMSVRRGIGKPATGEPFLFATGIAGILAEP